jgi:hypothetical protein
VRLRREPEDDYLHPVENDPTFNESRYYNFSGAESGVAKSGVGGWVRMGNRPNEGHAEMTVCLYLPDGRVGFMFARPRIDGHEAHDAAGLRFEVLAPYREHRVTYDGDVCVLARPRDMADPKSAFARNPRESCAIDLHLVAAAQPFGGEPEWEEGEVPPPGSQHGFARGHTEQHMTITGTVAVGGEQFVLTDAVGFRDHSWGPRVWQAIPWYRWLNACFGPLGIAFTLRGWDGGRNINGFVYDIAHYGDDRIVRIDDVDLTTEYDDELFPERNVALVTAGDRTYELRGEIWSDIPLRNRRDGKVTRITESMTRWTCNGLAGAGLTEHLDQIVDDVPVGNAAGV